MPNVDDNPTADKLVETLDRNRFQAIQVKSVLAANLWLALNLAAQRADTSGVKHYLDQIKQLTKSTIPLVNALGGEDVTNG